MSKNSHLKNGATLSYVETFSSIVVNLLYVPILLKFIGQAEYGVYQLASSIMAYLTVMESSLSTGTLRYYCKYQAIGDREKKENVLAHARVINMIMALIIVVVSVVAVFIIDPIYRSSLSQHQLNEIKIILLVFALNSVIKLMGFSYYAIISGNERFEFLKLLNIASIIIQPVIILLVIKKEPFALTVVIIQTFINLAVMLLRRYYSRHTLGEKIKFHDKRKDTFKGIFGFTGTIMLVAIADQIFWKADQLILAKLYNVKVVAIYAIGAQIFTIYMHIGSAISTVFYPRISAHVENNEHEEINEMFIKLGRLIWLVLGLVLGGFILFGQNFITLWVGNNYEVVYKVALIIMIPFTVDLVQNLGLIILQAYNKYMFRAKMYFIIAVMNIGLTIVMAKKWGMVGAALATAISITIGTGFIMNWYYAKKIHLDIKGFWKEFGKITGWGLLAFAGGFGITYIPVANTWITFILECLAYTAIYVFVMYKFAMNKWEKSQVLNFIK